MKKSFKKALSLFLSVLMVLSIMIPMGAFSVSASGETATDTSCFDADGKVIVTENWYANNTSTTWGDNDANTLFITNAGDLMAFANELAGGKNYEGKTITVTADIDMNPDWIASTTAPKNVWSDTFDKAFKGIFDGGGFTISGLYKEVKTKLKSGAYVVQDSFGFFGAVSGGSSVVSYVEVKNLAIVNSCINLNCYNADTTSGQVNCGGIFGSIHQIDTKLTNIYNDIDIILTSISPTDGGRVGGFVGMARAKKIEFTGCVYAGNIVLGNNMNWCSGFVGHNTPSSTQKGMVLSYTDCAFYGTIIAGKSGNGTFLGRFNDDTKGEDVKTLSYTRCISAGNSASPSGESAFFNVNVSSDSNARDVSFVDTYYCDEMAAYSLNNEDNLSGAPTKLSVGQETTIMNNDEFKAKWTKLDGVNVPLPNYIAATFEDCLNNVYFDVSWYDADGTYEIDTAKEFLGFLKLIETGRTFDGETVKLTADIDLSDYDFYISMSDKKFAGTFNGQNHTVFGYDNTAMWADQGMFGNVASGQSASVLNVMFVDCYLNIGGGETGGLFGDVAGTATIDNVYSDIDVTMTVFRFGQDNGFGGLVGKPAGDNASVTITNSVVVGDIDAASKAMVGGFVGSNNSGAETKITNSAFYGTILGTSSNSNSGFVGRTRDKAESIVTIENCIAAGASDSAKRGFVHVSGGTATVKNSVYTSNYGSAHSGATIETVNSVTSEQIKGSAAIATLKANNFDTTDTWVATVNGMPMPATVVEMIGALEVLELEENYGSAYVGYQTTAVENGTFGVRLIAIVDSLDHADVGFKVTAKGTYRDNSTGEDGYSANKVYESIQAAGVDYTADKLSNQGGYVITLVLKGFNVKEGEITFTVETFADDGASAVQTFVLDTTTVK